MDNNIPRHIAIIMDGNGRWAQARGLPRTVGHKYGAEAVKRTVEAAIELDISYLTLFGFSSENWKRPPQEVNELMKLLRKYLRSETAELHRNNICLKVIGHRDQLEHDIVELIEHAETLTKDNDGLVVHIALNYGGRQDILQAASDWAQSCIEKQVVPTMDNAEEFFPHYLMSGNVPDPDILIRTSGEKRLSNFLLWQCAYSELMFTDTLWPDFSKDDLSQIIDDYQNRDRRYGGLKAQEVKGDT